MADVVILKLQWAEKRLRELNTLLVSFGSHHQRIVIERDPETNEILYKLRDDPVIDPAVSLLAGDIFQHLRTALDYLACGLVIANGKEPTSQTCFPIFKDAPTSAKDKASFARKVDGMGKEAIERIEFIKPYKGGNPYLWPVHELNRREKHRLLFTVGAYVHNMGISQHIDATDPPLYVIERMARAYASDQIWAEIRKATCPLKAGSLLFVDAPQAKPNPDIKISIQVALNESGIFEGGPPPLLPIVFSAFNGICKVIGKFKGMYKT
jgi:hypothetical protein